MGITMSENKLKSYLLGLLSEAEQTQLELELLSEAEAYEQLLVAEEELIEAYLQDELTDAEKAKFERVFLAHPSRQQQLQYAQSLHDYARKPQVQVKEAGGAARQQPFWERFRPQKWALAMVGTVLLAGVGWLWWQSHQHPDPTLASPTPITAATQPPAQGTETASVSLAPGQIMAVGEELPEVLLSAKVGQVKLQLWLKQDQYESYKAVLQTYDPPNQKELPGEFKPQTTKQKLKFIEVILPATDLPGQIFAVKLEGVTASGTREKTDTFRFKVKP
jgi:hypothetical protein